MDEQKVAHNYALALFELSKNPTIISQLHMIAQMFERYHSIAQIIGVSAVDSTERRRWIAENLGDFLPEVIKFVQLLDEKGRIKILRKIAAEYEKSVLSQNNIERIYITTATPVKEEYLEKIVRYFEKHFSKQLIKEHKVDAKIIGGVKVRIGSMLYDDTIYTKLQKITKQMENEV